MTPRISQYPKKCRLCGAKPELVERNIEQMNHSLNCNWRNDPSWNDKPKQPTTARDTLVNLYESYLNDYLTVEVFAEHHGLTTDQGKTLIALARELWQTPHPEA